MAIQMRRGEFGKFVPSSMLPGEWAVVMDEDPSAKDGRSVYICFAAGKVKRMATYEDMVENTTDAIVKSIGDIKDELVRLVVETNDEIESAEAERVKAESARAEAEEGRLAAESARAEAEKGRAEAEASRVKSQDKNNQDQARNNADQAANNAAAQGLIAVILGSGEYDPDTLEPTVEGAVGRMYLVPLPEAKAVAAGIPVRFSLTPSGSGSYTAVPVAAAAAGDVYVEWLWINSAWERIGLSTATIDPIGTDLIDQVAADASPQGKQVLNLTGLSYLWAKIKAAFAPLTHSHPASQVTGLTASRALVSDASGHPSASSVSATELSRLSGVTSGVQSQLDALGDSVSQAVMWEGPKAIRFKWDRYDDDPSHYALFLLVSSSVFRIDVKWVS